jgi:hypothetical protein
MTEESAVDTAQRWADKEDIILVIYVECEDAKYVYKRYLTVAPKSNKAPLFPLSPMTTYTIASMAGGKAHLFCDIKGPLAAYAASHGL